MSSYVRYGMIEKLDYSDLFEVVWSGLRWIIIEMTGAVTSGGGCGGRGIHLCNE